MNPSDADVIRLFEQGHGRGAIAKMLGLPSENPVRQIMQRLGLRAKPGRRARQERSHMVTIDDVTIILANIGFMWAEPDPGIETPALTLNKTIMHFYPAAGDEFTLFVDSEEVDNLAGQLEQQGLLAVLFCYSDEQHRSSGKRGRGFLNARHVLSYRAVDGMYAVGMPGMKGWGHTISVSFVQPDGFRRMQRDLADHR